MNIIQTLCVYSIFTWFVFLTLLLFIQVWYLFYYLCSFNLWLPVLFYITFTVSLLFFFSLPSLHTFFLTCCISFRNLLCLNLSYCVPETLFCQGELLKMVGDITRTKAALPFASAQSNMSDAHSMPLRAILSTPDPGSGHSRSVLPLSKL